MTSAYRIGYLAGNAEPEIASDGNAKYVVQPRCPFPIWRFISWFLWHEGYYKGTINRLAGERNL